MAIDSIKTCSACLQTLPIKAFSRAAGYRDGYRGQCRECRSRLESSRITAKRAAGTWVKPRSSPSPRDKVHAKERRYLLRTKYGMTVADYDALLDIQGGKCAVCKMSPEGGKFLKVDHCHSSGVIRGLLCHKCNVGIGALGDNVAGLERALAYLIASASSSRSPSNG